MLSIKMAHSQQVFAFRQGTFWVSKCGERIAADRRHRRSSNQKPITPISQLILRTQKALTKTEAMVKSKECCANSEEGHGASCNNSEPTFLSSSRFEG
jgi:hypothetical protein